MLIVWTTTNPLSQPEVSGGTAWVIFEMDDRAHTIPLGEEV